MDNWKDREIVEQVKQIIKKVKSGTLYGRPIDINNPREVLLAAYLLGQHEITEIHLARDEFLRSLK